MKKTLAILVATTALTAAVGVPAWSSMRSHGEQSHHPFAAFFEEGEHAIRHIFARDDDDGDDGDDHRDRQGSRHGHDDDDDDDGDDHDDDDDDSDRDTRRNPAPAGTVAPPQNGLFGTGTPPRVQVN